jgi:hypothetical protein
MFVFAFSGVRQAAKIGEEYRPIPPLLFQVSGARRILFQVYSANAKPDYWSAGWLNLILQDAFLPTFEAIEKWHKLPLGNSLFVLPSQGIYRVRIEPNAWLIDVSIKAWTE